MAITVKERLASTGSRATSTESPRRFQRLRRDKVLVALGVPGATALILFQYFPLLGNIIAFKDYQPYLGISDAPFVGLRNFSFLWDGNPAFLNALANTLILTVVQAVFVFPIPLGIALLLNSLAGERLKRLLQSVLYLPHFLSWVIVVARCC
jgi:putative aldouronate transport system permease protein